MPYPRNPWQQTFRMRDMVGGGGYIPPKKPTFNFSGMPLEETFPQFQFDVPPPTPPQEEDPLSRLREMMFDIQAEGPASKAYGEYLSSAPDYEKYKPGKLRSIGAAIAGFGAGMQHPAMGVQVAQGIMDEPFNQAMRQWQTKEPGMRYRATTEQTRNESFRRAMSDYYDQLEKRQRLGLDIGKFEEDVRWHDIQKQRYTNEGFKEFVDETGNSWMVHPDGRKISIGPSLAGKSAKDLSTYRGRMAGAAEAQARAAQAAVDKRTPASEIPSQQLTAVYNKANEFRAMNPGLAQWVEIDPTTKAVSITKPASKQTGWFAKGPSDADYARIVQEIFGAKAGTRIAVIGPDGTPGDIPIEQLPTAIAQGYKLR